jgi:mannose-6-phosphate isomerase-like protein (cupin superfamily)
MKHWIVVPLAVACSLGIRLQAQQPRGYHAASKALKPDTTFENVLVRRLFSNEEASGFVIWVKQGVALHKHLSHSETVSILEGRGRMRLGEETITVRKGDIIFIPKGTPHSVKVEGKPLKVLSLQAPMFDGTDRVPLTE